MKQFVLVSIKPTVAIIVSNSGRPLHHMLTLLSRDMCRNTCIKKDGKTEDEEQHNYDHGHDNNDYDEQDEEEDDQLGD